MIRITDQYFWNFIFILFFISFVVMATIIVDSVAKDAIAALEIVDYVLLALAAHRVTRLFVYDHITKWFREQFYDAKMTKTGKVTLYKPATGPRRTLVELFACPWCVGVWASTVVVFFYIITPYAFFPVVLLALSSVATTLQLFTNTLGHRAEQLKQQNEHGL